LSKEREDVPMNIPADLLYSTDHEWARVEGNIATVGITDYAQGELGDIIFVEFPVIGDVTTQHEPFGTIEAVKTVADLFAPFSGKVVEINRTLDDEPEKVNTDPYGEGWIVKIEINDVSEKENLITANEYQKYIA
jgi:glycine cleavage system H protein